MPNDTINYTKLKSTLKCADDFEHHMNRHADDLDPHKFGWGWDCQGVAYAVATGYCSAALHQSTFEGTDYEYDFFTFLKKQVEAIKVRLKETAKHHGINEKDFFDTYNRNLGLSILERQRQYSFAESSIRKIDKANRAIVEMNP